MTDVSYPYEIDCVWLAIDFNGNVGAFLTGGIGPIPYSVLKDERIVIEDVEDYVYSLAKTSDVRLLVSMPRPDDFISLAERGIYVYDWSDVHRTSSEAINAYELVAYANNPITIDMLPPSISKLAENIKLERVVFATDHNIDIMKQVKCIAGEPPA
jgi:hypothetical protein